MIWVMVLECNEDYVIFQMDSYYFRITKLKTYNRNKFCIHAILRKSDTGIARRSDYSKTSSTNKFAMFGVRFLSRFF